MPQFPGDEWIDGVVSAVNDDGEFHRIASHFDATVLFDFGVASYAFEFDGGGVSMVHREPRFVSWDVAIRAPRSTWETFLDASRPPFYNDLRSAWMQHDVSIEGDVLTAIQYWRPLKHVIGVFRKVV